MTFKNTSTNANPTEFFPDVETFLIAGDVCPGQAELVDATKKFGWQINQAWGVSGATIVAKGDELVVAKFHISIWDEVTDWPAFQAFRKKYLSKAAFILSGSTNAKALGISHPVLLDMGVCSVVMLSISAIKNDGTGLHECDVEFMEYRQPKIQNIGRPDASFAPKATPTPTAHDNAEREMQKNDEIEKTYLNILQQPSWASQQ